MPRRSLIALLALALGACSSPINFPEPPGFGPPQATPIPAVPARAPTAVVNEPITTIGRPTATPRASVAAMAATLTTLDSINRTAPLPIAAPPIQIFVPSALGPLFLDLTGGYTAGSPGGSGVDVSLGSMLDLFDQFRAGGAVDVIVSADPVQLDVAQAAELIAAPPRVFARTRLSLVVPVAGKKPIAELKDLATPGVRWLTGTNDTPLGAATARLLERASGLPEYGATFRTQADRNVQIRLRRTDDLLERLADGAADAAIVYAADVGLESRTQLRVIDLPDSVAESLDYSLAILKGPNPVAAQTFVSYLQSPAARTILTRHGFVAAAPPLAAALPEAAASASFSPTFSVGGLITAPHQFTRAELAALPQETLQVTHQTDDGPRTETYGGTRLLNVFNAAGGARLPADINNAKLRVTVRVVGADGSEVQFGWGTLDPDFGAVGVLVAIERDGVPLADPGGMAQLVVPGDRLTGRSIPSIARIEVVDSGPHIP